MNPREHRRHLRMSEVTVVIGAGSIGQAIARRVSAGKQVLVADLRQDNADAAAEVLCDAGFEVSTASVDLSSRASLHTLVETATGLGEVTGVIHAAGVSPSQASPAAVRTPCPHHGSGAGPGWQARAVVAVVLGLAEVTVYRWRAQDLIDRGIKAGLSLTKRGELAAANDGSRSWRPNSPWSPRPPRLVAEVRPTPPTR
jgi:NAD(P)-dependent dehydrogenase (short-subunit alcohol dehydrogenase family)